MHLKSATLNVLFNLMIFLIVQSLLLTIVPMLRYVRRENVTLLPVASEAKWGAWFYQKFLTSKTKKDVGGGVVIWLGQFAKKSVCVCGGGGGAMSVEYLWMIYNCIFFLTLLVFFLFVLILCYNICFSFLNIAWFYL